MFAEERAVDMNETQNRTPQILRRDVLADIAILITMIALLIVAAGSGVWMLSRVMDDSSSAIATNEITSVQLAVTNASEAGGNVNVARIVGLLLLVFWIVFLPLTKKYVRERGSIAHATVFQWNVLPMLVGIGMIISSKLSLLIAIPILWLMAIPFSYFLLFLFPMVCGFIYGINIVTAISPDYSRFQYYGGGVVGVITLFVICTLVVGYVTGGFRKE